jgi:hypothetical protein
MLDRANAFRQHFDLDQERKYKELNLYVLHIPISCSVTKCNNLRKISLGVPSPFMIMTTPSDPY